MTLSGETRPARRGRGRIRRFGRGEIRARFLDTPCRDSYNLPVFGKEVFRQVLEALKEPDLLENLLFIFHRPIIRPAKFRTEKREIEKRASSELDLNLI